MYPSLYYFFKKCFGLDWVIFDMVKTFGLLMATAFIVAGIVLSRNLYWYEQKGFLKGVKETRLVGAPAGFGEIFSNALMGFIAGFKFPAIYQSFDVFRQNPEQILFSAQGNWILGIGAALFFGGIIYFSKKKDATNPPTEVEEMILPHMRVVDLIMIAALFGILGSKVLSSITDWQTFIADPLGSLLSFQGLTWYGGFFSASLALAIYLTRKKINFLRFVDATGPVVLLGYGIGRLGCHFAGDGDWGDPNPNPDKFSWLPDWLWAYDYPGNVARAGVPMPNCEGIYCHHLDPAVYPTPVWEFLMCLGLFGVLMFLFRRINIPGVLFGIYLVFNGVERFAIESIRITDTYNFLGMNLTQAQIIALGLIVFGSLMASLLYMRGRKQLNV